MYVDGMSSYIVTHGQRSKCTIYCTVSY